MALCSHRQFLNKRLPLLCISTPCTAKPNINSIEKPDTCSTAHTYACLTPAAGSGRSRRVAGQSRGPDGATAAGPEELLDAPPGLGSFISEPLLRRVQRGNMVGRQDAGIDARQTRESEETGRPTIAWHNFCLCTVREGQKKEVPLRECTGPLGDATRPDGANNNTNQNTYSNKSDFTHWLSFRALRRSESALIFPLTPFLPPPLSPLPPAAPSEPSAFSMNSSPSSA